MLPYSVWVFSEFVLLSYLVGNHAVIKDFESSRMKTKAILCGASQDNRYRQRACEGAACLMNKELG